MYIYIYLYSTYIHISICTVYVQVWVARAAADLRGWGYSREVKKSGREATNWIITRSQVFLHYMYVYIYIYIYIYIHTYHTNIHTMYVYIYIHIHSKTFINMSNHLFIHFSTEICDKAHWDELRWTEWKSHLKKSSSVVSEMTVLAKPGLKTQTLGEGIFFGAVLGDLQKFGRSSLVRLWYKLQKHIETVSGYESKPQYLGKHPNSYRGWLRNHAPVGK